MVWVGGRLHPSTPFECYGPPGPGRTQQVASCNVASNVLAGAGDDLLIWHQAFVQLCRYEYDIVVNLTYLCKCKSRPSTKEANARASAMFFLETIKCLPICNDRVCNLYLSFTVPATLCASARNDLVTKYKQNACGRGII